MTAPRVRSDTRSWFSLFCANSGVVALFAAGILVFLTAASVAQFYTDAVFATKGIPVQAEVVAIKMPRDNAGGTMRLTVRYEVPEGRFASDITGSPTYVARHPVGSQVTVYYLPNHPARIETHPFRNTADGRLLQVFAAMAGVMALGFGAWSGHLATSAVRARRYGERGFAKITRLQVNRDEDNIEADNGRIVFQDEYGRFGKSMLHPVSYLRLWEVGDHIHVYRGPRRSWWEGDVGPRQNAPSRLPKVRARRPE